MARGEAVGTTEGGLAVGALVVPVAELDASFLAAARAMTEPSGLTPARWRVLSAVRDGPRTVPAIAALVRMGMSRQAVQRLADELVTSGHAHWLANPIHQRSRLLEPTDSGTAALDAIIARQVAWANAIGTRLDAAELSQTAQTLRSVLQVCADFEREQLL